MEKGQDERRGGDRVKERGEKEKKRTEENFEENYTSKSLVCLGVTHRSQRCSVFLLTANPKIIFFITQHGLLYRIIIFARKKNQFYS